ncbi:MAG: F0F1 ATP synthase subunit beta, partial [Candidatus Omnitrophota bacterium]
MDNKKQITGRVVLVEGPVVDVRFEKPEDVPSLYQVAKTTSFDDREIILEVIEHLGRNIARC